MANWLQTLSSSSTEEDLIQARSMNITRLVGVGLPIVTAIVASISTITDTEPWSDPAFQQRLFLALLIVIAVVSVADMLARAYVAAAEHRAKPPAASLLPHAIAARKDMAEGEDVRGRVVAFRSNNADGKTRDGEYLFVPEDNDQTSEWIRANQVHLPP